MPCGCTGLIVKILISLFFWTLYILLVVFNILLFISYKNRDSYHIELDPAYATNGNHYLVKDFLTRNSCSLESALNNNPIPDYNSTIIGQNTYSMALIVLFWIMLGVSALSSIVLEIIAYRWHNENGRCSCEHFGSWLLLVLPKLYFNSTYAVPSVYMGLADWSSACLSLQAPLVYQFLFVLWLPTLIVSAASIPLVIIASFFIVHFYRKRNSDKVSSTAQKILGGLIMIIALPLCLYVIGIHALFFIPLIKGGLVPISRGVIICAALADLRLIRLLFWAK